MTEPTEELLVVPEDAADDFDPEYLGVEDDSHGDEELGDIPDDEVNDLG